MRTSLEADLDLLRRLHLQVLRELGEHEIIDIVERLVDASSSEAQEDPAAIVASLDVETAVKVTRAVTVFLHLANLAEERYRARSVRAGDGEFTGTLETGEVWPVIDALGPGAFDHLEHLRIHPVFTAHPTEARRRAVGAALRRIADHVDAYDDPGAGAAERERAERLLLEDIDILQRTSTLRRTSPGPDDELRTLLAVFEHTIFEAVPAIYRTVESALARQTDRSLPREVPAFLRFGSWVGADRDGNPFVTAEVTRATMLAQAEGLLTSLHGYVSEVARTLTMDESWTPPSDELIETLANDAVAMPEEFERIRRSSPFEAHRQKVMLIAERVSATRDMRAGIAYATPEEMVADLRLVQRSLQAAGDHRSAHGGLQNVIWLVETFGFHLAELEVRQHSAVHEHVLLELFTQCRDRGIEVAGRLIDDPAAAVGDCGLLDALATHGWPPALHAQSERAIEVLDTIRVMSWLQQRWGPDCCGRYIVSFSQSPAHLLAVAALARLAVTGRPLRLDVVPLFETGEDLRHATEVLDGWLAAGSTQSWVESRGRTLEIMLGYSDSAKDVGPASATLTLDRAQAELVAWGSRNDLSLTLFHGRGGSLGRGGGPLHRAIAAQPSGSIAGRWKVTEQGEVIHARYADLVLAEHHLQRVTSAVLMADLPAFAEQRDDAADEYRDLGRVIEKASREAYRALVDQDGVADLVAKASPLDEIGELRLGSRPARRSGATHGRSLADLRAIPWVFAWSMTRANVPGWYGLGSGLAAVGDIERLRQAYRRWPVFGALIDVAEMSLAKVNRDLAGDFLSLAGRPDLTDRILAELDLTLEHVLAVLDQESLLQRKPHLRTSVGLRAPHVDVLSQIQLRALQLARDESRPHAHDREAWRQVLLLTVNGCAAGLRNTG